MKYFLFILTLTLAFSIQAVAQAKKVKPATLTGQVVCSLCWDEADRKTTPYGTRADFECAEMCAENDVAQALAVKTFGGDFVLYLLEDGKFKRAGKNWLAYIAKNVEIVGTIRETDGKKILTVDSLKVTTAPKKSADKTKNQ